MTRVSNRLRTISARRRQQGALATQRRAPPRTPRVGRSQVCVGKHLVKEFKTVSLFL
jgi:hypothetical protein